MMRVRRRGGSPAVKGGDRELGLMAARDGESPDTSFFSSSCYWSARVGKLGDERGS